MLGVGQVGAALILIVLLFAPACLLCFAAASVLRVRKDPPAVLMASGAVIWAFVSMEFVLSMGIGYFLGAEELAAYALYSAFVTRGLRYVAMLLIGVGLVLFSKSAHAARQ